MAENKVIICAALAGAATMKNNNPSVPYTPEEFAIEAEKCYNRAPQWYMSMRVRMTAGRLMTMQGSRKPMMLSRPNAPSLSST